MKRFIYSIAFAIVLVSSMTEQALAAQHLIPVGQLIGLELSNDILTVAAFDDVHGAAARDAGLQVGDQILAVNGHAVTCTEDVRSALAQCRGTADLTILRGSKEQVVRILPASTPEGPRLGVYLRQGIAGIGTVTWYDPDTHRFGTLGHGVSDGNGLLHMKSGNAWNASVHSVKKGLSGQPGQLRGNVDPGNSAGTLTKNTPQGVFGISPQGWSGEPMPLADYDEVHTGPAMIRSTVSGNTVQEYSVEIIKIYPQDRSDCRNFLIRVTDADLLSATGGIVQGMSGSPIIQDGKLIGAVTHVLVNDPTTGYGIFIENMLDAAA